MALHHVGGHNDNNALHDLALSSDSVKHHILSHAELVQ